MKNRIRFISHKGKKILLVDASNCSAEELVELLPLVPARVTAEPADRSSFWQILPASKVRQEEPGAIKPALVLDRPYLKRSAWVGTENLPKVFYEHLKNRSRSGICPRSRRGKKRWTGWWRTELNEAGRRPRSFAALRISAAGSDAR